MREMFEKLVERIEDYLFEKYCVEGDTKIAEIINQTVEEYKEKDCCESSRRKFYQLGYKNGRNEYEDLEKQGLMLRLPCVEGTQVYHIGRCGETCYDHDMDCENCEEHEVIFTTSFDRNMIEQFGKTVFLTKEEAEHMLEK